ncbi:Fe-S oxidoreductase [Leucobacter coleopterorum]|uniref:Fe-S oxidoreductase n=1 Tax=Leucobacter coleopterorum TaxID=2714933 RepID=A0ABX6JVX7_9MICO|nr:Fe-S oxidoreductase [Leucobacter coleopterorum]QIM18456.1 Fe-S oxidoreductase [Leucobacter coleopterorum]
MQLGARWRVGAPPHSSLPPELYAEIAEQEKKHPTADSWTLTWLEGRPRAALDDLVIVSVSAERQIVVSSVRGSLPQDDDDDWLS